MRVKSARSSSGSGCANSTNSKPSVPAGFSGEISDFGAEWGNGPMMRLLSMSDSVRLVTEYARSDAVFAHSKAKICPDTRRIDARTRKGENFPHDGPDRYRPAFRTPEECASDRAGTWRIAEPVAQPGRA